MQEMWVWSPGQEDPLEEKMATHSSILTWKIPWTEEPGRLQFMGSQTVRYGWSDYCCSVTNMDPACQASLVIVVIQVLSHVWLFAITWTAAGFPCPSLSPRVCSNSCLFSQWCNPTNLSSVIRFSSCLHHFPASGSFLTSLHFASGGQSIGASVSAISPSNDYSRFIFFRIN